MSTLTLHLPDDVAAELAATGRAARKSPEEVASELIRRALLAQRFAKVREDLIQTLGEDAPKTDEEALRFIS